MDVNKLPDAKDLELLRRRMSTQFQLPSAYDDALSYQGLIYKLIQYLKDTMQNVEDWNNWLEPFVETFDTKLQNTVRDMIQGLYDSGKLAELTAEVIDVVQDQIDDVDSKIDTEISGVQGQIGDVDSKIDTEISGVNSKIDTEIDGVNSQLAQTTEYIANSKNAPYPLSIPTYDGSGQAVHPSVLQVSTKFAGYEYWMAYTPYPNTNDDFENPSIAVSDEGMNWYLLKGMTNPIDQPTEQELALGYHMSDTHLVLNNGVLECWYRFNKDDMSFEQILRKTSIDGKTWSAREVVMDTSNKYSVLSPAILHENGIYKMWYVSKSKVWYTTSPTGKINTWTTPVEVVIEYKGETGIPWHLSVLNDDGKHIISLNSNTPRRLFFGESIDGGLTFTNTRLALTPSTTWNAWDNRYIYRADLIKVGTFYRLYYSAYSHSGKWNTGMIEGDNLDALHPVPYKTYMDETIHGDMRVPRLSLGGVQEGSYLTNKELVFREEGVSSVKLKNDKANTLTIIRDDNSALADLNANTIRTAQSFSETMQSDAFIPNITTNAPQDKAYFVNSELKFFVPGKAAGKVMMDIVDKTIKITNQEGVISPAKASALILGQGVAVGDVEGAIRYNATLKKHQGYNGTTWNDLY